MADAIDARDLVVSLGGRPVLHGVTLSARFGEVLAILGPNGAGKSTLLRTLAGLTAYTGTVLLEGTPLARLPADQRARSISFVPQQSPLDAALTVREVVALARYAHRGALGRTRADDARAVDEALAAADVHALADRHYGALSTGEQKRTLIARALCTGARTLLLDEPSGSLDIEHALRLFALLRTLAIEGRAIVLVLHQIEHALAFADRALLLREGTARALGPTVDVITAAHVRALYGVELVPGGAPGFRLPEGA